MLGLSPTVWLVVQIALAVCGVVAWAVIVLPSLSRMSEKRLLLDVWAPLAIVGPVLFAVPFVGHSVAEGIGWEPIAGPIMVAMAAFGLALIRLRSTDVNSERSFALFGVFPPVVWTVSAIIVLLLCAANVLTVLVGQCVFAAAAVVLWISTPMMPGQAHTDGSSDEKNYSSQHQGAGRAILGTLLVAAMSIAQGIALLGGGEGAASNGALIAVGYAAVILLSTSIAGSPTDAMRLSAWSAALGASFGIGLLSLLHMLPSALRALHIAGDFDPFNATPSLQVANGFASLAPEAMGLLAIGLASLTVDRMGFSGRKTAGAMLVLAACCLLFWKVL